MLTLFILQTALPKADAMATFRSLNGLAGYYYIVRNTWEINALNKPEGWYLVLYDNEIVDKMLQASFKSFMVAQQFNAYTIMKKVEVPKRVVTQTPRLYRTDIELQENSLLPVEGTELKLTRILDGWILEQ